MEEPTAFKDLGIPCIVNIFARLSPNECATAACVCQLWAQVAAEDGLWRPHLSTDFDASSCTNHDGSAAASFKSAYASWRLHFADVYGPMLTRALAAWNRLESWLKAHSPRILASLNPGATAAEVGAAEAVLGHPLPTAMRVIYRVHNGQSLSLQQQSCEEGPPADLLMGLFGTTAFYDHVTSTQLAPLDQVVQVTRVLRGRRPLGAGQMLLSGSEVIYAHSFRVVDKLCAVDCNTGSVALKMSNRDWPLAPPTDTYPGAFDGILRWFEEYAARVSSGVYVTCAGEAGLADAGLNEGQAISLFPQTYPHAATAVTRGVKVTWSSVLVPQESRQGRLMFAYSVRYSLLTQQQQQEALLQLTAQEQAWQQRQQQQQQHVPAAAHGSGGVEAGQGAKDAAGLAPAGPSGGDQADTMTISQPQQTSSQAAAAAAAAAAGAGPSSSGGSAGSQPYRQCLVVGPCAASAGPAAVPPALATQVPWRDAAAAVAAGSSGGSSGGGSRAAAAIGSTPTAAGVGAGASTTTNTAAAAAAAGDTPSSCQLESRHWVIFNPQGSEVDRVDGEGVVGLYPLLYPGAATPFAYASCTPCAVPDLAREAAAVPAAAAGVGADAAAAAAQPAAAAMAGQGMVGGSTAATAAGGGSPQEQQQGAAGGGSSSSGVSSSDANRWQTGPGRLAGCVVGCMEGSFSFVEGSLMQRAGEPFQVVCPRLVFAVPEFIF